MKKNVDRLSEMWEQQHDFMKLLCERRGFPQFPVDMKTKVGQRFLKGITYDCMDELFEANQELKNSKGHRATEISELDREAYVEELVDALHYFFEIVIASGVTLDEMHEAYMKKGEVNRKRIESGYLAPVHCLSSVLSCLHEIGSRGKENTAMLTRYYDTMRNPTYKFGDFNAIFDDMLSIDPFKSESSIWTKKIMNNLPEPTFWHEKTEEGSALHVELPGYKKEDVSITLQDKTLVVKAERKMPGGAKTVSWSWRIQDTYESNPTFAKLADGILTIGLKSKQPPPEEALSIKIE